MNLIYNLKSILVQTKYNVYGIEQIKKLAPHLSDWMDIVLETDTHMICFKDIWTWNNLTPEILNSYLYGSEQINSTINFYTNTGKKYIFVLLTKSSHFYFDNKILNQKNIHIIKKFNQNKLIKEISNFLYSNDIYFYEEDNSVIMLE
jgi:hypothetical protein